ncbi:MAG: glycoside hydrolase family 97 protein [Bacteroidales bacterium]
MIRLVSAALALILLMPSCRMSSPDPVSPDGRLRVVLGNHGNPSFTYALLKDGQPVIQPSPVSLHFLEQAPFGEELDLILVSKETVDETWRPAWGKTDKVRNHYNEYVYRLSERGEGARFLEWVLRVYDDGLAFRYVFPENSGFGSFVLTDERTVFQLDPEAMAWAANHENYYSSQEHLYAQRKVGEIGEDELIGCPLLVEAGEKDWLLITEADLTDWAGLYFRADGSAPGRMVSSLASLQRRPEVKVESSTPAVSPWRVVMVGDDPGVLIESNLIANLNDPAEYGDISWIRPGVSAWDRWWSGDYGPDAGFELGMNTATMKYFIDLADEMNWEYMIVDWTWYGNVFVDGQPDPSADITTPIEAVDIRELIRYAGERDVGIILWVLSDHLDRQLEEALQTYEQWGAAGIKVDFMDCDDQDMVNWYHRVARKAAEHHLVIDFHGAYKPTGVSRTLPNMITREGVLGNEYTKWSDLVTPEHTVVLPFTRGALGEMDFTPGGFHHIHQDQFVVVGGDAPNPYVMGTRCHQLAMTVIYESAFMVICDSPYNYRGQPGSDFLKEVPSTWSETRFLEGYPGDEIIMARRSGDRWFVGGMSDETAREVSVDLGFLPGESYQVTLWKDAMDAGSVPVHLEKTTFKANKSEAIPVSMEGGGGFVMILDPV